MPISENEVLVAVEEVRTKLAGASLLESHAKLYSQFTRIKAGQPGLQSWQTKEGLDRLNEAMTLINVGLIEREKGIVESKNSFRRAAEIFEWLNHPAFVEKGTPFGLLSATCYQLAGYSARAASMLSPRQESPESLLLGCILKSDFPAAIRQLADFWLQNIDVTPDLQTLDGVSDAVFREIISSYGVMLSELRWGNDARTEKALKKIRGLSRFFLSSTEPYAWILSKLCGEVFDEYVRKSLKAGLKPIEGRLSEEGKHALERYRRLNFRERRALIWPTQVVGVRELTTSKSFVLCAPTGTGKTSVAELAIIDRMFRADANDGLMATAPLAIYIVPSRALAADVENRLARVMRNLGTKVVVTGLYGGTDWGPTDAWLTSSDRTVLICTYEKVEALIRFLGPLFLGRVKLVVLDEAHTVQFTGALNDLRKAESRSLRLESLMARLSGNLLSDDCSIIGLSAVAGSSEPYLARWLAGNDGAIPGRSQDRSTRQLIGRLEVSSTQSFKILYDIMDGAPLRFRGSSEYEAPFINNPFPPYPRLQKPADWKGPEKSLRPATLWAALQLASKSTTGRRTTVLVSITQKPHDIATDVVKLLSAEWANETLPDFFGEPTDPEDWSVWSRSLAACEDYLSRDSLEYQLLSHGIILHHSNLPTLLRRYFETLIERGIVRVIFATSTLSDGVNLPVEVVLVPTVRRRGKTMPAPEFRNLAGRAGRPGHGTEGRTLVLTTGATDSNYEDLYRELTTGSVREVATASPVGTLIYQLFMAWIAVNPAGNEVDFLSWLEVSIPEALPTTDQENVALAELLDTFDGVVLGATVEIEQLIASGASAISIEDGIKRVWQRTFAHYVETEKAFLESCFVKRSAGIIGVVHSDQNHRKELYRTGLPPRHGRTLVDKKAAIVEKLRGLSGYGELHDHEKLARVKSVITELWEVPLFRAKAKAPAA